MPLTFSILRVCVCLPSLLHSSIHLDRSTSLFSITFFFFSFSQEFGSNAAALGCALRAKSAVEAKEGRAGGKAAEKQEGGGKEGEEPKPVCLPHKDAASVSGPDRRKERRKKTKLDEIKKVFSPTSLPPSRLFSLRLSSITPPMTVLCYFSLLTSSLPCRSTGL